MKNNYQIGDWVECGINYAGRVTEMGLYLMCVRLSNGDLLIEADKVKPIPLTKEILEKNGFVKYRNYSTYHILTKDYNCIELRNIGGNMAVWIDWEENNDGIYYDYLLPYPKYVHELQHCLRMCNIEKEIEL